MKIGIDFDSTIAKIDQPLLDRLNRALGTNYRAEEWTDWDLNFLRPADRSHLFKLFTPDIYRDVMPYPGAAEAIRELFLLPGVELTCVTSNPGENGPAFTDAKRGWLARYIPE